MSILSFFSLILVEFHFALGRNPLFKFGCINGGGEFLSAVWYKSAW